MSAAPNQSHDEAERAALITEIQTAFANVTRENGVSWSEAYALDRYEPADACLKARASDKDRHWTELLDDPAWVPFYGMGGFCFLDPIGFRYYLPPTMIRILHGEYNGLWFHLETDTDDDMPDTYAAEQHSLLDARQRRCIARFIRYHIAEALANDSDFEFDDLTALYEKGWKQHDTAE